MDSYSGFCMRKWCPKCVHTFQLHPVRKECVRICIRNGVHGPHLMKPADGVWVKAKKNIRWGHELCSDGCETLWAV
jgi:hypothetical protein